MPKVAFVDISKSFGKVRANRSISFTIPNATIHGVVGENGAGKSTLLKILYGLYQADSGSLFFNDHEIRVRSPQDAIQLGVGMVHQHFMLVPSLTAWQNIVLGYEPKPFRKESILQSLNELQKEVNFSLDLMALVKELTIGERQQVEILKLLYRKSELLILDEPTAVLTPQETDRLFEQLKQLRSQGKTIILITHKLKEILSNTDAVTVLRQGEAVGTYPTASLTAELLSERMIGRRIPKLPERNVCSGKPLLQALSLSTHGTERMRLKEISFTLYKGEILGIAGVEGNGQQSLIEVLTDLLPLSEGKIETFFDRHQGLSQRLSQRLSQGLRLIPPDRHQDALLLPESIEDNFLLGKQRKRSLTWGPWLDRQAIQSWAKKLYQDFQVAPTNEHALSLPIASLSGGNQQKVVIARETEETFDLLVAAHPTRGVDVGAIDFIHQYFLQLRSRGVSILLISSELEELLTLSDRILVFYEGTIQGEQQRDSFSEQQLGLWMTGAE